MRNVPEIDLPLPQSLPHREEILSLLDIKLRRAKLLVCKTGNGLAVDLFDFMDERETRLQVAGIVAEVESLVPDLIREGPEFRIR